MKPPAKAPAFQPRVLAVDDLEANLQALQALLADMNCDLVLARSGRDALSELLIHDFALMLLDVQMPEMDGFEVARYARQIPAAREVPIIFLTAMHDTESGLLRGYGSGAVDILFKPISAAILRTKVQIFLELYSSRRQVSDAKADLERTHAELGRAYAELQATQAQLVQSAKMASLGALVAGVAHEINNPLSFVLSHLETARRSLRSVEAELLERAPEDVRERWDKSQTRLSEMNVGLERIRDLMIKLRTFSRLDEGQRKRASLRDSVDSLLTILDHRLGDRISITTEIAEPSEFECYPGILNQALMNLMTNAIDAIEGRGRIHVASAMQGAEVCISVTDSGSGIPDDIRERVLEPFFTTKPVGQGTGLGLSITYSIVHKHGGKLELRGAPGGGTVAEIRIPVRFQEE